jgi:hypothetical protein
MGDGNLIARVFSILNRDVEGKAAIAELGDEHISWLCLQPKGRIYTWRLMIHMDAIDSPYASRLADLHQRVLGAIEQAARPM